MRLAPIFAGSCLFLLSQCSCCAPMPMEWGQIVPALSDGCPSVGGEYEDIGEGANTNPSRAPYDIKELHILLPLDGRVPNPIVKFVINQSSVHIEISAIGNMGVSAKRTYYNNEVDGVAKFTCDSGSIVIKESREFSVEAGKGNFNSTIRLMKAPDGALIVKRVVQNTVTSLLIFSYTEVDEYWWRFNRIEHSPSQEKSSSNGDIASVARMQ